MVQPLVSLCCIESSGFLMMRLAYKMRSVMLVGAIKDFRSSEFAEIELRKCTSKYIFYAKLDLFLKIKVVCTEVIK